MRPWSWKQKREETKRHKCMHANAPLGLPTGPKKAYSLPCATSIAILNKKPFVPRVVSIYTVPESHFCSGLSLCSLLLDALGHTLLQCTHAPRPWPTGNKSLLAFAAQTEARILPANSAIFFNKRATPWLPSN